MKKHIDKPRGKT